MALEIPSFMDGVRLKVRCLGSGRDDPEGLPRSILFSLRDRTSQSFRRLVGVPSKQECCNRSARVSEVNGSQSLRTRNLSHLAVESGLSIVGDNDCEEIM